READRSAANDLRDLLVRQGRGIDTRIEWAIDDIATVDDFAGTVARCDYVIACRFHSVLVAHALGIPTLGLAYYEKTRELLNQVGHPERCLDIEEFTPDEVVEAFARLEREDDLDGRAALLAEAQRMRALVEALFDGRRAPRPAAPTRSAALRA